VAPLLPIAAILYSAGYLFFFRGLEIGNVSIVAATMNLWAVFTMLLPSSSLGSDSPPHSPSASCSFYRV